MFLLVSSKGVHEAALFLIYEPKCFCWLVVHMLRMIRARSRPTNKRNRNKNVKRKIWPRFTLLVYSNNCVHGKRLVDVCLLTDKKMYLPFMTILANCSFAKSTLGQFS